MRDIKFRAYCDIGEENKMLFFTEGKYDNGLWFEHTSNHIDEYLSPLMQFTGLKDKNGVDVYEGDVLITKYQEKALMFWHEEFACFCYKTIDEILTDHYQFTFKDYEIEIIGNIHENPDLCK